jgi:hypothetical protein
VMVTAVIPATGPLAGVIAVMAGAMFDTRGAWPGGPGSPGSP